MQSVKTFLWGPTPEQQKAKCTALVRSQTRKLDRDILQLRNLESKTKTLITTSATRASKSAPKSNASKQAVRETKIYARELLRVRRQAARLHTSRATLQSVGMQVNDAFAVRKIQGSIAASTRVMADVNSLIRLPELSAAMRELGSELMKAGIIEEMVDDSLIVVNEDAVEGEDEEVEAEVEKLLGEVLRDRVAGVGTGTAVGSADSVVPAAPDGPVADVTEEEEDQEEIMAQMRGRLEALKS